MEKATKPKRLKKAVKKNLINKPENLDVEKANTLPNLSASVSWQGNQPGYYKRSGWWYLIVTIITAALLIYAYRGKNNSFLFLILALYALVLAKSAQGPQNIYFSLSQSELSINSDERHYDLKEFASYYIVEDSNEVKYICFRYPELTHEDVIVPIEPAKLQSAIDILKPTEIKEDLTAREPMIHYLSRVLKI